jgi:hypothetical protein
MSEWHEDYDENPDECYEENPDENPEEVEEEFIEGKLLEERGLPLDWWTESIEKIGDEELREEALETAAELSEKEQNLEERLESGEISQSRYDHEKLAVLGKEKADFAVRCDLAKEDITFDKLGDLSEDVGNVIAEAAGNRLPTWMKEGVNQLIDRRGPEYVREWADTKHEEEILTDDRHESVLRQVRLHKK